MKVVSVNHITKSYGDVHAVNDISFDVEKGEIFGIIGPDGAGKTTLFRILTTLLLPDNGEAVIDGNDIVNDYKQIRQKVGYMPGKFSLYQDLSVEENLKIFATLFGTTIEENYHLIEAIYSQIEPFKKRRAGALSGGMKQKLALSCALIHQPVVLFLDEPTTGVDPVSRKELWDVLKELKHKGVTILVSTPYMDEANMCDRIGLIQNGSFLRIDTPNNIVAAYEQVLWAVRGKDMYRLLKDLRLNDHILTSYAFGDSHHVTVDIDGSSKNLTYKPDDLINYLNALDHSEVEIDVIKAGIEDCFMEMIK